MMRACSVGCSVVCSVWCSLAMSTYVPADGGGWGHVVGLAGVVANDGYTCLVEIAGLEPLTITPPILHATRNAVNTWRASVSGRDLAVFSIAFSDPLGISALGPGFPVCTAPKCSRVLPARRAVR